MGDAQREREKKIATTCVRSKAAAAAVAVVAAAAVAAAESASQSREGGEEIRGRLVRMMHERISSGCKLFFFFASLLYLL